jgi:peptide/nickel transport system substrate-binding protein
VTHGAGLGIEPALAVRWTSPEDTVWSFELREGVSFHDGTPLTPEHVVTGLERVRGDAGSPVRSWLASIASIEAEPPSRVVVRTRWPDPLLLHHLAQVPIALGRSAKEITEHPVGTGPYRVVSFAGGGLEVEAFPRWWGGSTAIPRARFVAIPGGEASIEALSRGRVDIAFVLLSAGRPHALPFPTQEARGLSTMFLWINALGRKGVNPLADVRVRRAVALSLDRQRLAERVTGREGDAAPQLVPATIFGSRPDAPFPPVDPAAARKLLAQAGHAQGLTLDLAFRDLPLLRKTAEEAARQLEAAGVRTTLRPVDYEGSLTPYREGASLPLPDFWTFDVPTRRAFCRTV